MNFLAHTMLAAGDAELIVGQFCGDFVRGGSLIEFPQRVQQGIRMHRAIDSFTDRHPVNARARNLFDPPYRRFATILTDVVYDHYLARHWDQFADTTLERHAEQVHEALEDYYELLPLRLQRFARLLIEQRWLVGYRNFEAVEAALTRISRRSERWLPLAQAGVVLNSLEVPLNGCFREFYPDLVQFVERSVDTTVLNVHRLEQ